MPTTPVSKRLSGSALSFKVGTTEYSADATNVTLTWSDADSSTVTFADAAAGGAFQATLKGTLIQSLTSTSFWRYAWANVGQTVAFTFAPSGDSTPAADNPVYSGMVKIGKRPDLGGDAQISGDDWTADFEWIVQGEVIEAAA